MKAKTVLNLLQFGGVLIILVGILIAVFFGSLYYVGDLYVALGIVLILIGLAWIYKVRKAMKRSAYMERLRDSKRIRAVALATMMFVLFSFLLTPTPASAQYYTTTSTFNASAYCYTAYQYTVYIEYTVLGFLVVLLLLSFIPIILGRTPLGPIFQELAGLAGGLVIIFLFLILMIFPISTIFTSSNNNYGSYSPPTSSSCTISLQSLEDYGPPLLSIFVRLIRGLIPAPP